MSNFSAKSEAFFYYKQSDDEYIVISSSTFYIKLEQQKEGK